MTRRLPLLLLGLLVAIPAPLASGAELWEQDARTRKNVSKAARDYFDPQIEFLWEPKKEFLAQLDELRGKGLEPIKDLDLLKSIVYEGRRFKPRFSDKDWRRDHDVQDWKKTAGQYQNLKSEKLRFTFSEPRRYPTENALDRKREEYYPLLFVFHEEEDTIDKRGDLEEYPGSAALERFYPKGDFSDLYDDWFVVAPVAPRAQFLDDDGRLRHRFSTTVLMHFWQRYHLDFDRIVVDGRRDAATFASMFPWMLAGLVLRGGEIDDAMVANFSTVPVYVIGDPDLKKQLDAAGHPDVTLGDAKGLYDWLRARKRVTPRKFTWHTLSPDHLLANWVQIGGAQFGPENGIEVEVVDTEENPNTIKIDSRGVESVSLYLNDQIVDLDREVNLILNGQPRPLGKLDREFAQLFERLPKVRENMNFAWLYPVFVPDVRLPAPPPEEETTTPAEEEVVGAPEDEAKAKKYWDKAVEAEEAGDAAKARELYGLVVGVADGKTSYGAKAQAKLDELKE